MAELGWYDKALECMDHEDYAQAKEYLEKALEEGETEAYCDLGNLYFEGNGVEHKKNVAHLIVTKAKRSVEAGTPLSSPTQKDEIEYLEKILKS